jgi:hypothetical protein
MGIWDFFTPDAGQKRRQWLNQNVNAPVDEAMRYYLGAGNSVPQIAGLLAEGSPVASIDRAGTNSQEMFLPDRSITQRMTSAGNMLSETAGAGLGLLGAPAASKVGADLLTDVATRVSKNAKKAGDFAATDMVGTARAIGSGDMDFLTGWGSPQNARAAGADVVGQVSPVPYERIGSDIMNNIQNIPTAGQISGGKVFPHAGKFTSIKSQQPNILNEHYSRGFLSDELLPVEQIDIAALKNRDLLSIVGDNSGRQTVNQVKDAVLENPVNSMAGFQYIDIGKQGYAGAKGASSSKFNEARKSEDPFYTSILMGEQSPDFALHTGQIFGEMFRKAPIATKNIEKIDNYIRNMGLPKAKKRILPDGTEQKYTVTVRPFTDFPSISDPNAVVNYINSLPTGTQRAAFLKGLDKADMQKLGVPKVADARLAAADVNQIGMDWGSAGYRGFTPDLEKGLYPTTKSQSTTYDTGIDKIGRAQSLTGEGRGIPANLLFRDLGLAQRGKGKKSGGGLEMNSATYKVLESSPKRAKQRVDDQLIDMVSTFREIEDKFGRTPAMEYAKQLLSGKEITNAMIKAARKANAPQWMLAMMAPASGLLASQSGEPKNRGLLN